ncbi:MAG: cytochrome c biogenesis protein CcdA [Solirubrobacterales bacterium]|nr:cytochrome c biogenesis protein CcdA [Solirubrobacterales bacterium]
MVDSPSLALAFAAGLVSFVSPCCLPLVPGYLATVCGKPSGDQGFDRAVIARSLAFVASFSAVFIMLGLTATAIGSVLFENQVTLRRVAGGAIAALGLLFLASVFLTSLNREWRPAGLIERAGRGGPLIAGVAFAVAWTPCVGPTLGAILGLASLGDSTAQGAGLLAVYSAGLGIPFLFAAVGFSGAQRGFTWIKRHYAAIQIASGLVLVTMGVLVFTNELFRLNIEVQQFLDRFGLNFFQSV